MGINTHYYTMYAVQPKGNIEEFAVDWDAVYNDIKDNEDMHVIIDGYGGDYVYIGKILFDSGDLRWSDFKDSHVEVDLNKLSEYKDKCTEQFMNYFPQFGYYMDHEWKLMTFVHYS